MGVIQLQYILHQVMVDVGVCLIQWEYGWIQVSEHVFLNPPSICTFPLPVLCRGDLSGIILGTPLRIWPSGIIFKLPCTWTMVLEPLGGSWPHLLVLWQFRHNNLMYLGWWGPCKRWGVRLWAGVTLRREKTHLPPNIPDMNHKLYPQSVHVHYQPSVYQVRGPL